MTQASHPNLQIALAANGAASASAAPAPALDAPVSAPHAARDAYHALREIVQAVSRPRTSGEALQSLYEALREHCQTRAMALEIVSGSVTRFQPYGEPSALAAILNLSAPGVRNDFEVYIFPLGDEIAPPGQITYVLEGGAEGARELLEAATGQIAMRLGKDTLMKRAEDAEEKARQRISEVATIYEIGQAIDQIELSRLLQLITDRAALLMDAQACSLMLLHPETKMLRVAASHGLPDDASAQEMRIGEGIAGRVAQTEQPMLIVGDAADPRLDGVTLRPDISSSMLVPMKSADGQALGILSIRRRRPAQAFTDDDLKLFSVFATQAALAVTNKHLYDDLRQRANELLKISSLSHALISTLELDDLLKYVATDICNVVGFERCCLYVRDSQRAAYVPREWRGYSDAIGRNPVRDGEGAIGVVVRNRGLMTFDAREPVAPDQERERWYLQLKGFARSLGTDTFVAVPIMTRQNRCIGVVVADNKGRREGISKEQNSLLSAFVNQAGIAFDNARLYEKMSENLQKINGLNDYLDNVLQSIAAGIVSTDARGQIARHNRAAEETLDLPAGALENVSLRDVVAGLNLPEAERAYLLDMIRRVQETGERVHLPKLALHPNDREPMTLNLMLSRLEDHNRERDGVVLAFEDITQEVRLEAEVEKMRRLADIGQLAAKMAHEVRNALSPIKGAAQIIRADVGAQGGSTEWPDIIIAEVDGLSHLTSEMLDFARPTPIDPRPLDIEAFLTSALQSLSSYLVEQQIRVRWNLAPDMPEAQADPIQLKQVVRNLVMNAAQAMPEGGDLLISTDYRPQTRQIAMRFRDNGVGIPREELERIFRPFVTTKTKGTGLGLPIVQKILTNHGGRVEVESEIGTGTCFSILLPLNPPPDLPEAAMVATPLISARAAGSYPDN